MKLLLAALFALGLTSLPVQQVAACSCMQSTPRQAAEWADAAFAGTVVNEQPVGAETGPIGAMAATKPVPAVFGQILYTFDVDGVAKGSVGSRVEVLSGGDGASCGMNFAMDERWLIFTTWDGSVHSTGLCAGNVLLEKGVEAPLPLTAPTGGDAGSDAWGIPLTVLALLGVIGAVAAVSWLAFRRGSATPA